MTTPASEGVLINIWYGRTPAGRAQDDSGCTTLSQSGHSANIRDMSSTVSYSISTAPREIFAVHCGHHPGGRRSGSGRSAPGMFPDLGGPGIVIRLLPQGDAPVRRPDAL